MTPFDNDTDCRATSDPGVPDERAPQPALQDGLGGVFSGKRRHLQHSDVFCRSEGFDGYVHLVEDGWAVEERPFEDGRRLIVDFILPGDIVGLNGLFLDRPVGEITSLTPMTTIRVEGGRLLERMSNDPEAAGRLLQIHLETAARTNERLVTLGRSAWERTAYLFLELWLRLSRRGLADGRSFRLPASQSVLADATGLSTVHFNRTLQQLRRGRFVDFDRGRVELLNVEELADSLCVWLDQDLSGPSSLSNGSRLRTNRQQLARAAMSRF